MFTYYLVQDTNEEPLSTFKKFISSIKSALNINTTQQGENEYIMSYDYHKRHFSPSFKLNITPNPSTLIDPSKNKSFIILNCEEIDGVTLAIIKPFARDLGYRIFDPQLSLYLPQSQYLWSAMAGDINQKEIDVIKHFGLLPVFYLEGSSIYYAKSSDGQIHLVNQYLVRYFTDFAIDDSVKNEMSFPVAKNIKMFVPMYDKGLIPTNFYEYWGKSTRIINCSGIDINNIHRKIFIKPFILEFDDKKLNFYSIAAEGASLLYMDKVRPGENLHQSIMRILSRDLGIAKDYIGAVVSDEIEFDRDREGRVTPRLIVNIYVEKIQNREAVQKKAQQGWISIKDRQKN